MQTPNRTLDSASVRARHTTLVLRLLRREGEVSRADLARRLDLARSTVGAIVDDLIEAGVVRELHPGTSAGGRRPMLLSLDETRFHMVGVDLGASHVTVVVTNLRDRVVARRTEAFKVREDAAGAVALVERFIALALAEARVGRGALVGIGVSVPSPVDSLAPGRVSPVVMPAWSGMDLGRRLEERFGVPVRVENDANAGALWEARWGAARRGDSLAYVKVATGVGAGLVIGGELYRGARGIAGELGHIAIDTTGPRCPCGLRGCLNMLAGSEALLAHARAATPPGRTPPATIDALVDGALAGDAVALATVEYAALQLGLGLAMLLNVLNPAVVVVGGGIVRAGPALLDPLRQVVARHCFSETMSHASIVSSPVGESATARGAATLLQDAAFEDPSTFFAPPAPRRHRRA